MSRRIGAYVLFDQQAFAPEVSAIIERVDDLTPVMQPIAYWALEEGRRHAQGQGEEPWPALDPDTIERKRRRGDGGTIGVGTHGGFVPSMVAFYGRRNAGWKTRAPHAHLFARGTQRYETVRWGSRRGGRRSRGSSSGSDGTSWNGTQRQPARPFDYFSTAFHDRANDAIAAYVLTNEAPE